MVPGVVAINQSHQEKMDFIRGALGRLGRGIKIQMFF